MNSQPGQASRAQVAFLRAMQSPRSPAWSPRSPLSLVGLPPDSSRNHRWAGVTTIFGLILIGVAFYGGGMLGRHHSAIGNWAVFSGGTTHFLEDVKNAVSGSSESAVGSVLQAPETQASSQSSLPRGTQSPIPGLKPLQAPAGDSLFNPRDSDRYWVPPAEGEVSNETVVVVVTHKNLTAPPGPDSTSWLLGQPYRFIVLAKDLPEGSPDNFVNHKNILSREEVLYLQFFIQYWDRLPARMVFAHYHLNSYHTTDIQAKLNALDPFSFEFAGLADFHKKADGFCPVQGYFDMLQHFWNVSGLMTYLPDLYPTACDQVYYTCCGTFLVTRERIRARPLALWKQLLEYTSNHNAYYEVEWSWHVLLGEPWWEPERDPWVLCPKDYHACHQK